MSPEYEKYGRPRVEEIIVAVVSHMRAFAVPMQYIAVRVVEGFSWVEVTFRVGAAYKAVKFSKEELMSSRIPPDRVAERFIVEWAIAFKDPVKIEEIRVFHDGSPTDVEINYDSRMRLL